MTKTKVNGKVLYGKLQWSGVRAGSIPCLEASNLELLICMICFNPYRHNLVFLTTDHELFLPHNSQFVIDNQPRITYAQSKQCVIKCSASSKVHKHAQETL